MDNPFKDAANSAGRAKFTNGAVEVQRLDSDVSHNNRQRGIRLTLLLAKSLRLDKFRHTSRRKIGEFHASEWRFCHHRILVPGGAREDFPDGSRTCGRDCGGRRRWRRRRIRIVWVEAEGSGPEVKVFQQLSAKLRTSPIQSRHLNVLVHGGGANIVERPLAKWVTDGCGGRHDVCRRMATADKSKQGEN